MRVASCSLSIVPLRAEPSHRSEMVTQILFGEEFEILEHGIDFDRIRLFTVNYEGWIQSSQYVYIEQGTNKKDYIVDLEGAIAKSAGKSVRLIHGTQVSIPEMRIGEEMYRIEGKMRKPTLVDFEKEFPKLFMHYLDSPYMWGGRSRGGIDCSGFSQVVYKHFGVFLKRDAWQQGENGTVVDFLPEIKAGDLAFFDNEEGRITHVGVMIDNETIIHAAGKVRIDKMDSLGIFNADVNRYSHKLRIIKRYFGD
ncbi:NlpC/P60 family protein [Sphingobacterium alkalisoli]|uniref:NlpC/P60 family protein n=1 Tax=Sphingobacterium alkalisoli TaxID=1874115 RepID=A0A4U0H229_9SPHI|nr:C40 family peptidase [Sphingobacterium alkalisoli]TJY65653.1 NlpC/P60 family protein [Sphingobacterium alkalisoli]GGH19189.1 hydrolase Nlp/P60 [Sphingobacterium alkalisoli]